MAISDKEYMNTLNNIIASNNSLASQAADKANAFSWASQLEAERYNSSEATINRSFQERLSNTAHQREVRDLVKAGLNPVLSANNGASVTSGSAGSVGSLSGTKADIDMQKASLYSQWKMNRVNNAQQLKINDINNKLAEKLARISAAASMYGANASAAAQRYAASQAAGASMFGSQLAYDAQIAGQGNALEIAKLNNETSEKNTESTNETSRENNQNTMEGNPFYTIVKGIGDLLTPDPKHGNGKGRSID